MSPPAAVVISDDLSGYTLDEAAHASLSAAAIRAKDARQHFLSMEQVLFAILEREHGAGPAHVFLRTLNVDATCLRLTIAKMASKVTAYSTPKKISLRSDTRSVLKLANELRQQRDDSLTHPGHITEALLCKGSGKAAWAVGVFMDIEAEAVTKLPLRLRRGLHVTGLVLGLALEFPETAQDRLGHFLHLREWNPRMGPIACRQPGAWDQIDCYLYRRGKVLRLMMAPAALTTRLGRWMCLRALRRKAAAVACATDARILSVAGFLREWPRKLQDHAGSLNRDFFLQRKPAGRIRQMTNADIPFCRDLYALLEKRRQVPLGFSASLDKWLEHSGNLRLAIEFDGALAGCGALWMGEVSEPADRPEPRQLYGGLSFGLIHPQFQRHGLGSTLLAFRMVAIHRMNGSVCRVEATDCSVNYLERAGFSFWHTWHSPAGESLYSGAMAMTEEDAALLEGWLGSDYATLLRTLEPPPMRPDEERD